MLLSVLVTLILQASNIQGYRVDVADIYNGKLPSENGQYDHRLEVAKETKRGNTCEEVEIQPGVPTVVMLSGTGEGKSTTSCVLSGNPKLASVAEAEQSDSETSTSCIYKSSWFYPYNKTEPLYIIDTPGFGDSRSDRIKTNNANIVNTLKKAGQAHAILWVLNSGTQKFNQDRINAFRFVRSYFGQNMYKHLVFVYTRFSWKTKRGKTANDLKQSLMTKHQNVMNSALREVEKGFWPDGNVSKDVEDRMFQLPYYAFNTRVDGDEILDDDQEELDNDDVFDPANFKNVSFNSAAQLRELKAKIVAMSQQSVLNLADLRPFEDGCKAALKDTISTPPQEFGQHLTDCVEGQLYKLLEDEVVPHIRKMEDGNTFAAFSVKAYGRSKAAQNTSFQVEAMNRLKIPITVRGKADTFTSYEGYLSCNHANFGKPASEIVRHLSSCLSGVEPGRDVADAVRAVRARFFNDDARDSHSAQYWQKIVDEIELLPDQLRDLIKKAMDFKSLVTKRILMPIRTPIGDIGAFKMTVSPSTTLEDIWNKAAHAHPVVKVLVEKGWCSKQIFNKQVYINSDDDLQQELQEEIAHSESLFLVVQCRWVPGSPPDKLDPELTKICLDNLDPLAMESLVLDKSLVLDTGDGDTIYLPNTAKHEGVFNAMLCKREGGECLKRHIEFQNQCIKKKGCSSHAGQGKCVPVDLKRKEVKCLCNPGYMGHFCEEEIPKKNCRKYKDNRRCGPRPIYIFQDKCEDLWDGTWSEASWYTCDLTGAHLVCDKRWKCQPETEGEDCCGLLKEGERWEVARR